MATLLCFLDTKEMAENNAEMAENAEDPSVGDIVSFCLEDSDVSDVDSKYVSLAAGQAELQQYVGAEGGDDISLDNEHDSSSYDSLVDNEEISPR